MSGFMQKSDKSLKDNCAMATHDMEKAEQTYDGFIASLKWMVPLIAIITLVVVVLIAD
ncbi:MAG: hypothetical protein ABJP48_11050 [Erythrobacter sp.]